MNVGSWPLLLSYNGLLVFVTSVCSSITSVLGIAIDTIIPLLLLVSDLFLGLAVADCAMDTTMTLSALVSRALPSSRGNS